MNKITVDLSKKIGKIKPLHCVNNGPACNSRVPKDSSNFYLYKDLGIPYARNHDASFFGRYGLEHTVDVVAIFPNFDADPYDPANYDFTCTDDYIATTEEAGTHHFYRLGHRIEHEVKKYGTLPPKDFKKWAVICEHIIRHYTEGWADGFYYDMPYWEIWNEPNLNRDESLDKKCWGGTAAEFYLFFRTALEHLKTTFPHLKIGGPSLASGVGGASSTPELKERKEKWARGFFESLGEIKPDFISWHVYFSDIEVMLDYAEHVRNMMVEYGLGDKESILNEWNYVCEAGWFSKRSSYIIDVRTGPSPKCSSYTTAAMIAAQHSSIDMLMLYDARPSSYCSLFKPFQSTKPLKTYYSLWGFNKLYRAENEVEAVVDGQDVYALAASDDKTSWVMLTHYNDNDETEAKQITLELNNIEGEVKLEVYVIDDTHDGELVRTDEFESESFKTVLSLPLFTSYIIKIEKL